MNTAQIDQPVTITPAHPAAIRFVDVSKSFDGVPAIRGLDLDIHDGELLVLLGPSGCGKTTTLNMLAGLEQPTAGQLFVGDQLMNDVPPEERDIAMVFQSIALYPHLNVRANIGFALATRKVAKATIAERTTEVASILSITELLDRRIHQLSGGQRQRVAIAKALVRRPRLFLLDEPFSSLDAALRRQMRSELVRIHRAVETTMVFVTHDQEEAMAIADRIAVMNGGRIVQVGPPLDLYQAPADLWAAQFVGAHPINVIPAQLDGGTVNLATDQQWRQDAPPEISAALAAAGERAAVAVRPEHLEIEAIGSTVPAGSVAAEVYTRQILGTEVLYELQVGALLLRAVTPTSRLYSPGDAVSARFQWTDTFVFDGDGARRYPAMSRP